MDSDGVCRWVYIGCVVWHVEENATEYDDWADQDFFKILQEKGLKFPDIEVEENDNGDTGNPIGTCHVCGKNPLKYNFLLKYNGNEHHPAGFISNAGSECIQSLDRTEQLKIEKEIRLIKEAQAKYNAVIFGKYMEPFSRNPKINGMNWNYYFVRNFGESLKYFISESLKGKNLYEKPFGKAVRKYLEGMGIILPDMREMKKIVYERKKNLQVMESAKKHVQETHAKISQHGEIVYADTDSMMVKAPSGKHLEPSAPKVEITDPVLKALKFLAGDDLDFASEKNNVGFNKMDVEFGHSLASFTLLSEKQKASAVKMLRKYHRQIPPDLYRAIYGEVAQ